MQGAGGLMLSASLLGSLAGSKITALAIVGKAVAAVAWPLVIIGGVLLAIGLVFVASQRTDLEQWISEGFWGSSKRYWDDERPAFNAQLTQSRKLITSDSDTLDQSEQLLVLFNDEMRAFEKLIWPINASQIEDDLVVKVEFQGLTDEADLAQLSISIENYQPAEPMA
ncbi:hypothetical protein LH51_09885 [Nitrincola sp. A-D6]|nr:hypothetical protein LH51_09885 [Nitrincola sp. A-D6]